MRRTVWMLLSAALLLTVAVIYTACSGPAEKKETTETSAGWIPLFDGESLAGWTSRGGDAEWKVEDGAITAVATKGPSYIATTKEYSNFQLMVDFWTDEGHNSGIFIRGPVDPETRINQKSCYEINIADDHKTFPTGSIVDIFRVENVPKTAGKWNTYDITADGDHILVKLNGQTTADIRDSTHTSGIIALQAYGTGQVKFRNVKLRPID